MKRKRNKWLILFLCAILTLDLSACGKKESANGSSESETQDTPSLVYESEYFEPELEEGEGVFWNDAFLVGDELFFHALVFDEGEQAPRVLLRRASLTKGNSRETVLQLTAETVLNSWSMDDNGDIYALLSVWNSGGETEEESFTTKLARYDSWGNEVYAQDITDILAGENSGSTGIAVDGQGRVFLICNNGILLFDETGKSCGSIDMSTGAGSLVNGFCRGIDGKVYISATVNSSTDRKATLYEADFGAAKLGNGRADFPVGLGRILSQDADGNFLLYDQSAVFRYDPKDGQTNKLFDWLDINLTGTEVCAAGGLSDGRIALVYQDRNGSGGRVALLPETGAAVTHKQKLVLGTLTTNYILQDLVVNFNKSSDAWQVTVKAYLDDDSQSDAFKADALVRLNSDIASGNGPDLFLFSAITYGLNWVGIPEDDLDVKMLADKGVFEDLTPYLEQSAVLSRDDMYDSVLDAYTFDGVLVSIPKKFALSTYFGGAKQLGDRDGWTLDEMMACYKAHPDRELFYEPTSMSVMNFCLMFNLDSFVDWEKGTCHFDSPEFKGLLEFAAGFSNTAEVSELAGVYQFAGSRKGELLLGQGNLYCLRDIQYQQLAFQDEAVAAGYPTLDGSCGCGLTGIGCFAISSQSDMKEGAWAFIESYLVLEEEDSFAEGFPTRRSVMDRLVEEELKERSPEESALVEYVGENEDERVPVLDEYGRPYPFGTVTIFYEDGMYPYRYATREEVDQVLALIDAAKPFPFGTKQLFNIIEEEAEAFYQGQKSVDEVADIIQRRVEIYVSEHM